MTYATLKSNLTTAATAAGVTNFVFGYYDELQKKQTEIFPAILITPPVLPLKTRQTSDKTVVIELEMWLYDRWTYESTSTRESVWDAINTKAITFFQSLQSNSTLWLLSSDEIDAEPIDMGTLVSGVICCKYKFKVGGC